MRSMPLFRRHCVSSTSRPRGDGSAPATTSGVAAPTCFSSRRLDGGSCRSTVTFHILSFTFILTPLGNPVDGFIGSYIVGFLSGDSSKFVLRLQIRSSRTRVYDMGIIHFSWISRYYFNHYPFVRLGIIAFEIYEERTRRVFKWRGFGAFFPSGGKIEYSSHLHRII